MVVEKVPSQPALSAAVLGLATVLEQRAEPPSRHRQMASLQLYRLELWVEGGREGKREQKRGGGEREVEIKREKDKKGRREGEGRKDKKTCTSPSLHIHVD